MRILGYDIDTKMIKICAGNYHKKNMYNIALYIEGETYGKK